MEKNKRPLIAFVAIMILVMVANYLIPISATGSVTITDEISDTPYPEQPCTDVVEATVERNETNLIITIKVDGDIPNQTEPGKEGIGYSFSHIVRLDLEDSEWIPKVGSAGFRGYWVVHYAGEDFPGSFTINQKGRTVRIILDLNLLRERGILRDIRCESFSWFVCSSFVSVRSFCEDKTVTAYFPDYSTFIRQSNMFYLNFLVPILIGGIIWWWIGLQALPQSPRQARILGVIFRFHGIYWLAVAIHFLTIYIFAMSFIGVIFGGIALGFFLMCYGSFKMARGILRGEDRTRKFGLFLSALAAVFGLYPLAIDLGVNFFPFFVIRPAYFDGLFPLMWKSLDLIVGATSLLCIYYLTRPQVKAFLD